MRRPLILLLLASIDAVQAMATPAVDEQSVIIDNPVGVTELGKCVKNKPPDDGNKKCSKWARKGYCGRCDIRAKCKCSCIGAKKSKGKCKPKSQWNKRRRKTTRRKPNRRKPNRRKTRRKPTKPSKPNGTCVQGKKPLDYFPTCPSFAKKGYCKTGLRPPLTPRSAKWVKKHCKCSCRGKGGKGAESDASELSNGLDDDDDEFDEQLADDDEADDEAIDEIDEEADDEPDDEEDEEADEEPDAEPDDEAIDGPDMEAADTANLEPDEEPSDDEDDN